jgi:hypothetical protein
MQLVDELVASNCLRRERERERKIMELVDESLVSQKVGCLKIRLWNTFTKLRTKGLVEA